MSGDDDNPQLAAALRYAAKGWPVFPCSAVHKRPLVARDKDGDGKPIPKSGGVSKATTDERQIRAWWRQHPRALIGVSVGKGGLVAVDFDPRVDPDTGEVFTLERLKAELEAQIGEVLPKTVTAVTPSGGVHVYFRMPDGVPIGNRGNLPEHVDVRGEGGYTIMPPGALTDDAPKSPGGRYRWRFSPETTEVAEMPAGLEAVLRAPGSGKVAPAVDVDAVEEETPLPAALSRVSPSPARGEGRFDAGDDAVRKYALAAADAEIRALAGTGDGGRNNALNAAAFNLGTLVAAGGLSEATARGMLMAVASGWPDLPKSTGTIDSGLGAGMGNPRDLSEVRHKAEDRARYNGSYSGNSGKPRGRVSAANIAAAPAADADGVGPVDDASPASPAPDPREGADSEESSQMGGWRGGEPPERGEGQARLDRDAAYLVRTDLGNAERWNLRHGADFAYCDELGWLAWDGRRWSKEEAERRLMESAFDTVRAIQFEAKALAEAGVRWREEMQIPLVLDPLIAKHELTVGGDTPNPDPWVRMPSDFANWKRSSDTLAAWGRTSESLKALNSIVGLARTFSAVKLDRFDADPMKLNVANGTLIIDRGGMQADGYDRVPTVTLVPHCREHLITMIAPVLYAPGAGCPVYDAFMARVQPDAAVRRFLHAWGGYSLTGDASEQKFVINHGALGANGKSTWIDTIAELMGDYAISVNIAVFMDEKIRSGSSPSPDLAELPRKRLVRTSEPPRGHPFAEALVKLVTGGEPLPARQLNKPFFRFLPEFKITVSMNPVPQLSDDAAIWRRTRVVPWDVSIPEAERDQGLKAKLAAERSGVLNRLITGLLDWCEGGLPETEAVAAATAQIRDSLDPLGKFLKVACAIEAGARVNSTALYDVFKAWCLWGGEKEWTQIGFSKALGNKGFDKVQSNTMHFVGLRLVRSVDDFVVVINGQKVSRSSIGGEDGSNWEDYPPDAGA